ncbi:MAG: hypothetical protein K2G03_00730 [Bacilli bacterium]|nr:hypothetical protein [Bacilli bacterium]
MKKLKAFYRNNRIYCILMLVSLFCFILMGSAVIIYFVHQASSDKYGTRLDDIDSYPVSSELAQLETFYKESDGVKKATVRLQGKIIYVSVEVDAKLTVDEMQNIATESLTKLTEEQKSYYDLQFTFNRDGLAPYSGSKASSRTVITWSNYNIASDETTTTTTSKKKK